MRPRLLWLATTADEYELPIAVADTCKELASLLGKNVAAVAKKKERRLKGENSNEYKVFSIPLDEEGDGYEEKSKRSENGSRADTATDGG